MKSPLRLDNDRRSLIRDKNNAASKLNSRAQEGSRYETLIAKTNTRQNNLHQAHLHYVDPERSEAIRYYLLLAGILLLGAIYTLLGFAGIAHFVASEGGGRKLQLLANFVVPAVMVVVAIILAYKGEDIKRSGSRSRLVSWYILSVCFVLLMSCLSFVTQLAVAESELTVADWGLLVFKVGLNIVVEVTILGSGITLIDALGYFSFKIKNLQYGIQLWLQGRTLDRLEAQAIDLVNQILTTIESYNKQFAPDRLPTPEWTGKTRLLVNRLAERELIPPPTAPIPPEPAPDRARTEPPAAPTPPQPTPDRARTDPPAAPTPPEPAPEQHTEPPAAPTDNGAAEAAYKRNFDEANARRRDGEVEP